MASLGTKRVHGRPHLKVTNKTLAQRQAEEKERIARRLMAMEERKAARVGASDDPQKLK